MGNSACQRPCDTHESEASILIDDQGTGTTRLPKKLSPAMVKLAEPVPPRLYGSPSAYSSMHTTNRKQVERQPSAGILTPKIPCLAEQPSQNKYRSILRYLPRNRRRSSDLKNRSSQLPTDSHYNQLYKMSELQFSRDLSQLLHKSCSPHHRSSQGGLKRNYSSGQIKHKSASRKSPAIKHQEGSTHNRSHDRNTPASRTATKRAAGSTASKLSSTKKNEQNKNNNINRVISAPPNNMLISQILSCVKDLRVTQAKLNFTLFMHLMTAMNYVTPHNQSSEVQTIGPQFIYERNLLREAFEILADKFEMCTKRDFLSFVFALYNKQITQDDIRIFQQGLIEEPSAGQKPVRVNPDQENSQQGPRKPYKSKLSPNENNNLSQNKRAGQLQFKRFSGAQARNNSSKFSYFVDHKNNRCTKKDYILPSIPLSLKKVNPNKPLPGIAEENSNNKQNKHFQPPPRHPSSSINQPQQNKLSELAVSFQSQPQNLVSLSQLGAGTPTYKQWGTKKSINLAPTLFKGSQDRILMISSPSVVGSECNQAISPINIMNRDKVQQALRREGKF